MELWNSKLYTRSNWRSAGSQSSISSTSLSAPGVLSRILPAVFRSDQTNSTGGLVALGLGAKLWTVSECLDHFTSLCEAVFTPRSGSAIPLVGPLIENYHHSKYQTSTMESAFQNAFGENLFLFGGQRDAGLAFPLKVAVTATNLAGNKSYVLTNYNQPRTAQSSRECIHPDPFDRAKRLICLCLGHYHFQRPEASDTELRVWEA